MKRIAYRLSVLLLAVLGGFTAARALEVKLTGRIILINPAGTGKTADNSNAVVWLTPLEGRGQGQLRTVHAALGRPRLRLVQKHKRFEPHLLVVPVGSAVEFPNLDPFFHNVFSLFEGKRFDLGLYEAGTTRTVSFDRPGICYIFCNIHPEMSAVVVVLETPYYAVSGRAGEIVIPDVPPGRYQFHVWHERSLPEDLKALSRAITVSEDTHSLGTIRVTQSGNLALAHKNKYGRDYDTPTPPSPLYEQP
jgi:plastocyanin